MNKKELAVDVECKKCHSSKVVAEFIENEHYGDAYFVVCIECGFDREAHLEDFE